MLPPISTASATEQGVGLAPLPAGAVTAGLDWATHDHVVAVVDDQGRTVERFTVAHSAAGLAELVTRLQRAGAGEVAIERGDGRVVETLLAADLTVVVISPNQLANLRGRYGSVGNKDDRFDAYVLADTLRTDRARLRRLRPSRPDTVVLRAAVRARKDLLAHRIALANQLRAHLKIYYPGPVGLFCDLDGLTSLKFLDRFPDQQSADWLTPSRLGTWLRRVGYTGRRDPAVLHAHLTTAPRGVEGPAGTAAGAVTRAYVAALLAIVGQLDALEDQIAAGLAAHPDKHVFTSLPRAGVLRAGRLLAEIGDCRARFPTPESLASLAGVTPSTRRSGKTSIAAFRFAADRNLRDAACEFANDTRHVNPWAADLYRRARARGHRHPHAVRILARAWLHVIWRCWQDHQPYNPDHHRALQLLLESTGDTAPPPASPSTGPAAGAA